MEDSYVLCGHAILIGAFLTIVFGLVYCASGGKITFRWSGDREKHPSTLPVTTFSLILIPLTLCVVALLSASGKLQFAVAAQKLEAMRFWDWFDSIDRQLYKVKSDDDPLIKQLQGKLAVECPGLRFRIGPVHNGRRELAFVSDYFDPAKSKTNRDDLVEASLRRPNPRWYVGFGFSDPCGQEAKYEYGVDGRQVSVSSKDFYFNAVRKRNTIDVVVFTDVPVENNYGDMTPVGDFVKNNLGDELFCRYLGDLSTKKLTELQDKSRAQTVDHIHQAFLDLLTERERMAQRAIVTSQPCVEQTFAPTVLSQRDPFFSGNIYEPNPFVIKRKHGGLSGWRFD